jgi:hypothetical protein
MDQIAGADILEESALTPLRPLRPLRSGAFNREGRRGNKGSGSISANPYTGVILKDFSPEELALSEVEGIWRVPPQMAAKCISAPRQILRKLRDDPYIVSRSFKLTHYPLCTPPGAQFRAIGTAATLA